MGVLVWLRAVAELVLPRACAGCGALSTWWCDRCAAELARDPVTVPFPSPSTLRCVGIAPYRGAAGTALVALKERGVSAANEPLAAALARAVVAAAPVGPHAPGLALVPVPSRPAAVRARGADVLAALARECAAVLRAQGVDAVSVPCLAHARRVVDQTGLDPWHRGANLDGAMRVRSAGRRVIGERAVVVVDDVVTTGASVTEAVRALRAGVPGCSPVAAVVAVAGPCAEAVTANGSFGVWVVPVAAGG